MNAVEQPEIHCWLVAPFTGEWSASFHDYLRSTSGFHIGRLRQSPKLPSAEQAAQLHLVVAHQSDLSDMELVALGALRATGVTTVLLAETASVAVLRRAHEAGVDHVLPWPGGPDLEYRLRDVVRLAQQSREMEAQRLRLEDSLRTRDEITLLLVHDLRGGLAALQASLELASWGRTPPVEVAELVSDALLATRRLTRLTSGLLEMGRLEARASVDEARPIPLPRLVSEAVCVRRSAARRAQVRFEVELDRLPVLLGDPDLILRVVENVLDNALRYAPPGGLIRVWAQSGVDGISLCIGNNGPPIPERGRNAIFEKFSTSDTTGRAHVGLGLYFCRLAVNAHGGELSYEQTDELPTIFKIWLPSAAAIKRPCAA